MGAWIEIAYIAGAQSLANVAPHVGAWIEIIKVSTNKHRIVSHPTWVRGLKFEDPTVLSILTKSHPTWVRGLKCLTAQSYRASVSRTPRGCVD